VEKHVALPLISRNSFHQTRYFINKNVGNLLQLHDARNFESNEAELKFSNISRAKKITNVSNPKASSDLRNFFNRSVAASLMLQMALSLPTEIPSACFGFCYGSSIYSPLSIMPHEKALRTSSNKVPSLSTCFVLTE